MKTFLFVSLLLVLFFFIYWFRALPFQEKKTKEPELSAHARLISKDVTTGAHRTGRSSGMGYNYRLTFRLDTGEDVLLYAHDTEWGSLREETEGLLRWQGRYFVHFEEG